MSVSYPGQSLKCVNVTTLGPRTLHLNIISISGILQEQYSGAVWAFIKIFFIVSGLLGNFMEAFQKV